MDNSPNPHAKLKTFLKKYPSIEFIRYVIVDYANIPHCVLTPASQALAFAQDPSNTGALSICPAALYLLWNIGQYDADLLYRTPDHGVPDWDTLKPTSRVDQGMVMRRIKDAGESEAEAFDRDPRTVLKRVVDKAKEEFGIEFKIGFEIEFRLLDSPDTLAVTATPQSGIGLSAVRHPSFDVIVDAVRSVEKAGVPVWSFLMDEPGVFEIALGPVDPMTAVDNLIYAHDAIKSMAIKHGLFATMHPTMLENAATLGQHIHLSLDQEGHADAFLAGLLRHFPGVVPMLLGGFDSYSASRSFYYGGNDVFWGYSKMLPIRRIGSSRFEIRVPDSLGNPFFQVASLIGIGLDGVRKGSKLEIKECKQHLKPGPLDEATKKELGVTQRIPASLEEACKAMEQDEVVLREVLGPKCYETLLWHRKTEIKKIEGMTKEERSKAIIINI